MICWDQCKADYVKVVVWFQVKLKNSNGGQTACCEIGQCYPTQFIDPWWGVLSC